MKIIDDLAILNRDQRAAFIASVLGWISLAVAVALVRRRIKLEENHLHGVFGQTYESYVRRTARMFPGFY